jgi:hypothetical protein
LNGNRPYSIFQQSIDSGFSLLIAQREKPFGVDGEVDEAFNGLIKESWGAQIVRPYGKAYAPKG